jgi:hypothetical protein
MHELVKVGCKLDCRWEGLPPAYRAYVNDELFTERTWYWTENFIEEIFQIQAHPGKYRIRFELIQPCLAELSVLDMRVLYGPARIKGGAIKILETTEAANNSQNNEST